MYAIILQVIVDPDMFYLFLWQNIGYMPNNWHLLVLPTREASEKINNSMIKRIYLLC